MKEFEGHVDAGILEDVLRIKANDELFVVDRVGSKNARLRMKREGGEGKGILSAKADLRKIVKLAKKLKSKEQFEKVDPAATFDLWESEPAETEKRRQCAKVKVPHPGQSYNPSLEDHQDALAEATAIELLKREKDLKTSVVQTAVATITNADLDSSDDESDGEGVRDPSDNSRVVKSNRRLRVMTRAEKNKKRLRKAAAHEISKVESARGLLKAIDSLPTILKSIEGEEIYQQSMKALRDTKQQESVDKSAMTYTDAGMIPLTDELNGSLRNIIPKGSRIKERVLSLVESGSANSQTRRKRRAYEKPYQSKNIRWVAKFKHGS